MAKVAIYNNPGSFSDRWIEYCVENAIPFYEFDLYQSDLIENLRSEGVSILLAHPDMMDPRSQIVAKSIFRACENLGINTFPPDRDYWHFDDKLAQKYIFESYDIPIPKSYAFYDRYSALEFADRARYPLVFKLRRGAGSINVRLARSKNQLIKLIYAMFSSGISANDAAIKDISTKIRIHRNRGDWLGVIRRAPNTIKTLINLRKQIPTERGYVLLQEFLPNNDCDVRVNIIGRRAFMFKRLVRPDDFRASGSYMIDRNYKEDDIDFIHLALEISQKMNTYCIAFDFIRDCEQKPVVVEMSYAFNPNLVFECDGYWTPHLKWVSGHYFPQDLIIQDMLESFS